MSKRLNLALPEKTLERVENVRVATNAASATEVIRSAILTYEALVEWLGEGASFYVKDANTEQLVPVKFMIDISKSPPGAVSAGRV